LAFGVWRLAFGVRRSAFGVWRLAFGVRRLAFGVWRLAFGFGGAEASSFTVGCPSRSTFFGAESAALAMDHAFYVFRDQVELDVHRISWLQTMKVGDHPGMRNYRHNETLVAELCNSKTDSVDRY
jgi:hypothetical protein